MTSSHIRRSLLVAIVSLVPAWLVKADITFVPGDYYTSDYESQTITQYDNSGNVLGSLTLTSLQATGIQGITFGPDGFLYATLLHGTGESSVAALDGSGVVHQTYNAFSTWSNLTYGKLAIANGYLYVGSGSQLTRYVLGDPSSGIPIYNNEVYGIAPLPNGNLFVASNTSIAEITNSGELVRTISLHGDDNFFTDIRSLGYNAATNELFVTDLGHTGFFQQLMRLDASTGVLEKNVTFNNASDILLTLSGNLLVGSRTEVPTFFDQDLNSLGTLGGGQQLFVTQDQVPEPQTAEYLVIAGAAICVIRKVRRTKNGLVE